MITEQDKLQFKAVFGVPITNFKSILSLVMPFEESGIDIIKFDNWLRTPDNVSCMDFIIKKYGKEAAGLIERVL